jgi:uncharacterized protein
VNEKAIKAVFDTQLFLRACINQRSLPAKLIFDMADKYELVASQAIIDEIEDVLNRPKLRAKLTSLTDDIVEQVTTLLSNTGQVNPSEIPAVSRDPKDDMFLACAISANATHIVSEDKDLLVLNPYNDIQIINAFDFLEILQHAGDK